jgi:hypothetical protein
MRFGGIEEREDELFSFISASKVKDELEKGVVLEVNNGVMVWPSGAEEEA